MGRRGVRRLGMEKESSSRDCLSVACVRVTTWRRLSGMLPPSQFEALELNSPRTRLGYGFARWFECSDRIRVRFGFTYVARAWTCVCVCFCLCVCVCVWVWLGALCWFALLIFRVSTYMLMCIVASCFGFVCVGGLTWGPATATTSTTTTVKSGQWNSNIWHGFKSSLASHFVCLFFIACRRLPPLEGEPHPRAIAGCTSPLRSAISIFIVVTRCKSGKAIATLPTVWHSLSSCPLVCLLVFSQRWQHFPFRPHPHRTLLRVMLCCVVFCFDFAVYIIRFGCFWLWINFGIDFCWQWLTSYLLQLPFWPVLRL